MVPTFNRPAAAAFFNARPELGHYVALGSTAAPNTARKPFVRSAREQHSCMPLCVLIASAAQPCASQSLCALHTFQKFLAWLLEKGFDRLGPRDVGHVVRQMNGVGSTALECPCKMLHGANYAPSETRLPAIRQPPLLFRGANYKKFYFTLFAHGGLATSRYLCLLLSSLPSLFILRYMLQGSGSKASRIPGHSWKVGNGCATQMFSHSCSTHLRLHDFRCAVTAL